MYTSWPNWPNSTPNVYILAHTQVEVAKHASQAVVSSGPGVYYVQDVRSADAKMHEVMVDEQPYQCCNYVVMHKQPCRHMVCVFHKNGMLGSSRRLTERTLRTFWPKYFHSDNYKKMYENVRLRQPEVYTGKYLGPEDLVVLRPKQRPAKRGRKRKARYRWQKTTKATVKANMGAITHAHYEEVREFM